MSEVELGEAGAFEDAQNTKTIELVCPTREKHSI